MSMIVSERIRVLVKVWNPRIRQRLITAEEVRRLPTIKEQDGQGDQAAVYWKLFGSGRWTWYITEAAALDREDEPIMHGDRYARLSEIQGDDVGRIHDLELFGYVISGLGEDCDEWAYFRLSQLAGPDMAFPPFGLPIERDAHWEPAALGVELRERWGITMERASA